MSHITSMIEAHPNTTSDLDVAKLADCIAACFECAQTCTACADACLGEEMVTELRNCIRLNLDCADVCTATGHLLSRRTGSNLATVKAALEACRIACALRPVDAVNRPAQTCWQSSAKPPDPAMPEDQSKHLFDWSFGMLATISHRSAIADDGRSHLLGCGLVGS